MDGDVIVSTSPWKTMKGAVKDSAAPWISRVACGGYLTCKRKHSPSSVSVISCAPHLIKLEGCTEAQKASVVMRVTLYFGNLLK